MQTDKKLLHILKRKLHIWHIEKENQVYTSLLLKAEEDSKHVFQVVGICPVPVRSEWACKEPQNNHHSW